MRSRRGFESFLQLIAQSHALDEGRVVRTLEVPSLIVARHLLF